MSEKSEKKRRRQLKKFNKEVFKEFTIEVSIMPFWKRLGFCLNMAFLRHELQRGLKPEIEARRTHTPDGEAIKPKKDKPIHRSFRLTPRAPAVQ